VRRAGDDRDLIAQVFQFLEIARRFVVAAGRFRIQVVGVQAQTKRHGHEASRWFGRIWAGKGFGHGAQPGERQSGPGASQYGAAVELAAKVEKHLIGHDRYPAIICSRTRDL
jgi:hypothetical protein